MDVREKAQYWLENVEDDELLRQLNELLANGSKQEIEDAFFQDLSFGTAGLRGIIGPGTNRMNIYTVGQATQGLADYINAQQTNITPSVAIARDSRHKGELFCKHAASILAANGIRVYLYPRIAPTPALSFAVRYLGCSAGICMTASHNPASYNGYKAYGNDGCQITSDAAFAISSAIGKIDMFSQVKIMDFDDALDAGLISWISDDVVSNYLSQVFSLGLGSEGGAEISVVYTPLCGTGLEYMEQVFSYLKMDHVYYVATQKEANGDFPTCEYPNPEEKEALEEGIKECEQRDADLLLATDPDADRIGVAVRHNGSYILPTGNEMGILLLDYICKMHVKQGSMPKKPFAVSTVVSTAMIDAIAASFQVEVRRCLTGFKYIGEMITQLEPSREEDNFIFGFEESYGYLSGSHVRDKDAINAGLLICQMARFYKEQGLDLIQALEKLYEKFGFYANRTINVAFPGAEGSKNMKRIMDDLRINSPELIGKYTVEQSIDYAQGYNGLPPANMVEFCLEGENKIIFRPSGTEPKIKLYLFAKGSTAKDATSILDELEHSAKQFV